MGPRHRPHTDPGHLFAAYIFTLFPLTIINCELSLSTKPRLFITRPGSVVRSMFPLFTCRCLCISVFMLTTEQTQGAVLSSL